MPPSQALNEIRRLRRDRYGQVTRANRLNLTRGSGGGGNGSGSVQSNGDNGTFSYTSDEDNSSSTLRQRTQSKSTFIDQYTSSKKSLHSKAADYEKHESLTSSLLDANYLEMKALGMIPSMKKRYAYSNKLDQALNGDYIVAKDYDSQGGDDEDYDDEEFCCISGKDKFSAQRREFWRRRLRDFYIFFFVFMFLAAYVRSFFHGYSEDTETINILNEGLLNKAAMESLDIGSNENKTLVIETLGKLDSVMDMTKPYNSAAETPFLLDIALSGSSVVKAALSKCHGLVLACEVGLQQPNYDDNELQTFASTRKGFNAMYVNVDTSTVSGLERASKLGLVSSRKSDVIAIKSLYDGADLFQSEEQSARMFAMFVHPIYHATGDYHYLKKATWDERYHSDIAKMTLHQFALSKHLEVNPMVRQLSQSPGVDPNRKLTKTDLEIAKRVVETKCLVGLYRDLNGSLARFDRYFGWSSSSNVDHHDHDNNNATDTDEEMAKADKRHHEDKLKGIKKCRSGLIYEGDRWLQMQTETSNQIKSDSVEYKLLSDFNDLDMKLYTHIENIYEVQGDKIFGVVA